MIHMTPFLQSLIEAPQKAPNSDDPEELAKDTESLDPEKDAEGTDDTQTEDNATQDSENTDDQNDNNDDDLGDDPLGDETGDGEDNEDLNDNPDGLPSPDDTGEGDSDNQENDEQNIQLNILPLSKLDRLTLKRKCYNNFRDLRVKTDRVRVLVDDNEQVIDATFRDEIQYELSELYSTISGYLTTKFSFNNYEENMKNYTILATQLDEIIKKLLNMDEKGKKTN